MSDFKVRLATEVIITMLATIFSGIFTIFKILKFLRVRHIAKWRIFTANTNIANV